MKLHGALLTLAFAGVIGCANVPVIKNSREGLFDKWAKLESVPGATRVARDEGDESDLGEIADLPPAKLAELRRFASRWDWPLKQVQVTSPFGKRKRDLHEGVDLRAEIGTPVFASDSGVVVYAGRKIRGYGKMIVIKHGKGLSTVYAHNSQVYVKKGQRMRKGQKIALSGATGRVSGPHLHYEVRHGVTALDPKLLLGQTGRPRAVAEVEPPRRTMSRKFASKR